MAVKTNRFIPFINSPKSLDLLKKTLHTSSNGHPRYKCLLAAYKSENDEMLSNEDLLNRGKGGKHKFYVSDNPEWFSSLAERFLGKRITNIKKVDLA